MNLFLFKTIIEGILILYFILRTIFYIVWKLDSDDESIKITFSVFKKLYPLYPSKWSLDDSYVVYRPNENSLRNYYIVEFKTFLKELQKDIDKYREENFSEMKKHIFISKYI